MLWLAIVVLYGLGAVLMHARLALLDGLWLSDLPLGDPVPSPSIGPVPRVLVALWPLAVIALTCLALYLTRPQPRRRVSTPAAMPPAAIARRGAVRPRPAISPAPAVMPRQEDL